MLIDGHKIGCERQRGVKGGLKVFGLNNWWNDIVIN